MENEEGKSLFRQQLLLARREVAIWRVWVIIEWCHHLVVIKQYCWLDHCTDHWVLVTSYNPPISSIQNVKGWKYCCRQLFIFLTQKHYLQFSTTYSFISLVLAESVIGFIYIDKVVLLIPNQCCSTPQQILGQRWSEGVKYTSYNNHADMNSLQNPQLCRPCHIGKVDWFFNWVLSKD